MYDRGVTDRAVAKASERLGFELTYHSQAQISAARSLLDALVDIDRGGLKRNLAPDEQRFIQNERTLCALDARYYYAQYCNPPEAPIWMADGTFRPIGHVSIGDKVIGWAKATTGSYHPRFDRDHYTEAVVTAVQRRIAPIVKVVMESGRVIRCTPDHLWSNGNSARTQNPQKSTRKGHGGRYRIPWVSATPGAKLRWALEPIDRSNLTQEQRELASWLGGIFDGEGSFAPGNLQLAQDRERNPVVYEAIGSALTALGFHYSRDDRMYSVKGGFRAHHRFFILCRPVRDQRFKEKLQRQVHCQTDRVVDVIWDGEGEVVSLQTSTGNYVAWGYLSKNCTIVNWEKKPQLFNLNVAQKMMLDIWADFERNQRAIHLLQLKARRLGVSTLSELEIARGVQFIPYTNAVVASADPTKSVIMADMIDYCWQQMPWWLMPKATKIYNRMPVEFAEINTGITIQAGNQFNGVARGATPNRYHVSEIAEWVDAESLIDGALLRAIIDTSDVFGIIEGTGEGRGNYLHKTWELLKQLWPLGRARQMPVFLPWYVGTDIYPSPAEQRSRPIPKDWIPSDRTIRHADRAAQYVRTNPLLLKHLAKGNTDWRMPREQMWFYEVEWETAKQKKTLNIFLAEMASDDFDAFQSSNTPVVDQEILIDYRERTRVPQAVYTIIGDMIPEGLSVSRRHWLKDPDHPPITIKVASLLINCPLTFQFVPVTFEGYAAFDPSLKLLVWDFPENNETYGIGVDTSEGVGKDNSVIEVLRKASPYRPDAQVAEFASAYIKAFQLWPMVLAVSCFYSVLNQRSEARSQVRVCIECKGNGEACQHELQKRGWRNFHPWKRYDNKIPTKDAEVHKFGIYTNVWFRPQMLDMLLTCFDEQAIDIPSPYLIQEFESLEKDERVAKMKAAYGDFDDRVMAIGFPLFSLHVGDNTQMFARRKVELLPAYDPEIVHYPIWQPGIQEMGLRGRGQEVTLGRMGRPNGLARFVNQRMPKGFR